VSEDDPAIGGHHERGRHQAPVPALSVADHRAVAGGPDRRDPDLGRRQLAEAAPLQAHGVVGLTLGIAQALQLDLALAAEVAGGLRAVLERAHHLAARRADLLPGPIQLDQVLSAERSAEVAHERHYDRAVAPALAQRDRPVDRLERYLREGVAFLEAGHQSRFPRP
jgi:hypothetical protein